jgi:hypothetical protein
MADRPNSPYDIASKMIVDADPVAFARLCGPADSAELLDTNFASNVYADRLLKVRYGDSVFLRHVEVQSGYERKKLADAGHYASGAHRVHDLEVFSVFVLLNEAADGPAMTGHYSYGSSSFGFDVLRLWQFPVEKFLEGALAHLPLTALCDIPEQALPGLVDQMSRRIKSEPSDITPSSLWIEFDLLLGLKYPQDFVQWLLKGVGSMQESSTYQAILAEGEARGIALGEARGEARGKRESILQLGSRRFGAPDAVTRSLLEGIDSLERLDGLVVRAIEAESWNDLLSH